MKAQEMKAAAERMSRKTVAQQRRLTAQINQLLQEGEAAALAYLEAVSCRQGLSGCWDDQLPDEASAGRIIT
jgi:hypothetical protein